MPADVPTLPITRIADLLTPFYDAPSDRLLGSLSIYLDLLLYWNARTNLTAIRDPEEIVTRHFGESLFLSRFISPEATTLLDLGTGAGFPGVPIQLAHPGLQVTLAESQNKKAAFLHELVRKLDIKAEVWSQRVEKMPSSRTFSVVALRAVDDPRLALKLAEARVSGTGTLLLLATNRSFPQPELTCEAHPVPGSDLRSVFSARKIVPRGTI